MKRMNFTQYNWAKSIKRLKWATRRCHNKPRYQVGDIVILTEPTRITRIEPENSVVDVVYPWDEPISIQPIQIPEVALDKILNRAYPYGMQPAMFMLQSFARHYVEITEVKQEPLWDISDEDCIAEGIEEVEHELIYPAYKMPGLLTAKRIVTPSPRVAFAALWDSINGKKQGKRWGDNPTVFAYGYNYLGGFKP